MQMRIGRFFDTSHPVARFVGQLVLLAACIAYSWYLHAKQVFPIKQIRENFTETRCFIAGKKLSTHHYLFSSYRADFLVSYRAGPIELMQWASGNGIDASFHHYSDDEKTILTEYEIGERYPCWFNPQEPQQVALVLREYSLYSFVVPAMIGVAVLYSLLMHLRTKDTLEPQRKKRRKAP